MGRGEDEGGWTCCSCWTNILLGKEDENVCVCVHVCTCVHVCMSREDPSFPGKCLIILLHLRVGELLSLIEFANTNCQQR